MLVFVSPFLILCYKKVLFLVQIALIHILFLSIPFVHFVVKIVPEELECLGREYRFIIDQVAPVWVCQEIALGTVLVVFVYLLQLSAIA